MSKPTLGIIGGGQLGSMLAIAANKLEIKTIIFCDDIDAPAQNFSNEFIHGDYNDQNKINEFVNKVDIITFEFENIPFETLNEINKSKPVLPKPSVNRIIQHRLAEKDFINKLNIRTTRYVSIEKKSEIESVQDMLPGLLKTTTLGYDGKGQYLIQKIEDLETLNIDFSKGYILEKLVKLKKEISIIITRFDNKKYEIYEPVENLHEEQILKYSKIPAEIENKVLGLSQKLSSKKQSPTKLIFKTSPTNEAFLTASSVQFVGKGINLFELGMEYSGRFDVLNAVLRTCFLWDRVRVQGGAYGSQSSFDSYSGDYGLVSYRDPNLTETLDIYDQIGDYLETLDISDKELTKILIGCVGRLDPPMTADRKGSVSMVEYLTGKTYELKQKRRDE